MIKMEPKVFCLRQYDMPLLSFEITEDPLEGQKCHILKMDESRKNLFPIGMVANDQGLMSWLRGRVIPKNREYVILRKV